VCHLKEVRVVQRATWHISK